jgi:outer membrane protein
LIGHLLGVPDSFDSSGTSASLTRVDTLGLNVTRFLTDRWSIDFAGGIPARINVFGSGVVSPGGAAGPLLAVDLGDPSVNPLGSARQWSPALMAGYHFARIAGFEPFVEIGLSYTWFTQARLNPAFENRLNSGVGQEMALAAGKPGPTSVSIDPRRLFAPVVGAGLPWRFARHWLLIGSAGFAPFATRTRVDIRASDGSLLSTSQVRIDVDALVTGLLLGYVF